MFKRHGKYRQYKRSLQVPLKNYKVSVPGELGVSHTQICFEAQLTLPSTHYSDFKQLNFTVELGNTKMLLGQCDREQKAFIFKKDNSSPSFLAFDIPDRTKGCAVSSIQIPADCTSESPL